MSSYQLVEVSCPNFVAVDNNGNRLYPATGNHMAQQHQNYWLEAMLRANDVLDRMNYPSHYPQNKQADWGVAYQKYLQQQRR